MDREKVIKGLECCIRHGENAEVGCGRKNECPYEQNGLRCWLDLNRDALALLKEQEGTIKTLEDKNKKIMLLLNHQLEKEREQETTAEIEGGGSTWWYVCGECHGAIDKNDRFCRYCGKKVKWE